MDYFSNSTNGEILDQQCSRCRYGQEACPIFAAQFAHNYDACNNEVAAAILNELVNKDGICQMRKRFKKDLATDGSVQCELF